MRGDGDGNETARAIRRTLESWAAAIRSSDVSTLVSLVTEDAEFWAHGAPAIAGREALASAFEPLFASFTMEQEFERDELIVAGDHAFMRGMEVNRLSPRGGGETTVRRQRAFSVLRRGEDGVWRFARGMTNAPPESE